MKLKHLAVLVLVAIATTANAGLAFGSTDVSSSSQGDVVSGVKAVNRYFKKRPTQKHAILSTGECAAGIAFSSNPVGAATVGLPVLALGNGLAYFLRNAQPTPYTPNQDVVSFVHNAGRYIEKHPTLLQDASGSFCLAYGLSRSGRTKPQAKINKPVKPTEPTDPTSPTDPPTVNGGDPPTQPTAGNGGVNGGHDTNKPPFPGKGPKGK